MSFSKRGADDQEVGQLFIPVADQIAHKSLSSESDSMGKALAPEIFGETD